MGERERWDVRHAAQGARAPRALDPFVLEALEWIGPAEGRSALDLACGRGRHALELARRGWRTSAWDISPVALAELERRAAQAGLSIATRALDLAGGLAGEPGRRYDLALAVDFLDRGLLGDVPRLLRPGGHLLVTTFTSERQGEHPRVEWCLEPGELARGLDGLETRLTRERDGRAGILARLPWQP